jgi:hypothetical protein
MNRFFKQVSLRTAGLITCKEDELQTTVHEEKHSGMKKLGFVAIALALAASAAVAQDDRDHVEVGAFADYFRLNSAGNTGYWGVGGRLGAGLKAHLNVEADMAYDFEQNVTSTGTGTRTGITTSFSQVNGVRLWHGVFGPMFWLGTKHARVFGEVKGGFINFSISGASPTAGLTNVSGTFFTDNTKGAFYPGGGVELSVGPLGLRADIADFMYFSSGAVHNLSVKVGPTLHF